MSEFLDNTPSSYNRNGPIRALYDSEVSYIKACAELQRRKAMSETTKVRILVGVNAKGDWASAGWTAAEDTDLYVLCAESLELNEEAPGEHWFWVEADLPLPETKTVAGAVVEAKAPEAT